MVVAGLVSCIVAIVLAWLAFRKWHAAPERGPNASLTSNGDKAAFPASRSSTTLGQLRDLRDALKPAEHRRIERRRAGGAGPYAGPERRRAALLPPPKRQVPGVADEVPPAPRRWK